jgi:serine/threonine protein kinase
MLTNLPNLQFMSESEEAKLFSFSTSSSLPYPSINFPSMDTSGMNTSGMGNKFVVKFKLVYGNDNESGEEVYRRLMSISHPNIVKVYEVGNVMPSTAIYDQVYKLINWDFESGEESDINTVYGRNIPFVISQHIDGYTIDNRVITNVIPLIQNVFSAIKVFQKYLIVHDDLQPQNIMFNTQTSQYVIIDFDLSYFGTDNATDKEYFIETLETVLFYPNKKPHTFVDSSTVNTSSNTKEIKSLLLLPDVTEINKFYNFAVLTPPNNTDLNIYITVLSALLGNYPFTLQLEEQQTGNNLNINYNVEVWRYGVLES